LAIASRKDIRYFVPAIKKIDIARAFGQVFLSKRVL
jgi:hypothetical protein